MAQYIVVQTGAGQFYRVFRLSGDGRYYESALPTAFTTLEQAERVAAVLAAKL